MLAGFLCFATGVSAPAATVRVATFNVLNYLAVDRRVDGEFRPAYPKPESEKAAVRAVIRDAAPDVLALQEMGPAPYLEELRQDLAREGAEYRHAYVLEAADPERHVAVLSRRPFARVAAHADVEFTYFSAHERVKRGVLEIAFADDSGTEWTLFVVHLKSRLTDRADDPMSAQRRVLEARAVRDLVLKRFPDPARARFVIAGDFNDTKDSKPLAAMRERGRTTITELLPAVDRHGLAWTHRYAPADSYSRVDFMLVSPALRSSVVGQRAHIHDGAGALEGSDHRLVWMDLDFVLPPTDRL